MSWIVIVAAGIGIWLASKMVGALLKAVFWAVALAALYWVVAPALGLPELMPLLAAAMLPV